MAAFGNYDGSRPAAFLLSRRARIDPVDNISGTCSSDAKIERSRRHLIPGLTSMSSFSPAVNLNSGDFVYQMRGNGIWRFGGNGERPNLAVVSLTGKATWPLD